MVVLYDPRLNASLKQELEVPRNAFFNAQRFNLNGPLWSKHEIETILKTFKPSVIAWTEECNNDVVELFDDPQRELALHVAEAIDSGIFENSQWCEQNPVGPVAPCDSYILQRPKHPRDMYIKFAVRRDGMAILVYSCHYSKFPRPAK